MQAADKLGAKGDHMIDRVAHARHTAHTRCLAPVVRHAREIGPGRHLPRIDTKPSSRIERKLQKIRVNIFGVPARELARIVCWGHNCVSVDESRHSTIALSGDSSRRFFLVRRLPCHQT